MNIASIAAFAISFGFAVSAVYSYWQGQGWSGLLNTGLMLTNFAWGMMQRG